MNTLSLGGKREYYRWLVDNFVYDPHNSDSHYEYLLQKLFLEPFKSCLDRDADRAEDGDALRNSYLIERDYTAHDKEVIFGDFPVSLLEVMIALASRMEVNIMSNSGEGDRTSYWFWMMANNLGVVNYTDEYIESRGVQNADWNLGVILERFAAHEYEPNGVGGLFYIPNRGDVRNMEIWYQMHAFIQNFYNSPHYLD
jgi:hypothetical protein